MASDKIPDSVNVTINGSSIDKSQFSDVDYGAIYTSIYQNMDRENSVINYRVNWALWISAAFITAEAFVAGAILKPASAHDVLVMQSTSCFFMACMSAAAVFTSWRANGAVSAAIDQLSYLKYFYLNTRGDDKNLFESFLRMPRPFGDPAAHKTGNNAAKAFPPALITLWAILTLVELAAGMLFMVRVVHPSSCAYSISALDNAAVNLSKSCAYSHSAPANAVENLSKIAAIGESVSLDLKMAAESWAGIRYVVL